MKYTPDSHQYVEHHTYTGKGCAVCGKEWLDHLSTDELLTLAVQAHGPPANIEEWARQVGESVGQLTD